MKIKRLIGSIAVILCAMMLTSGCYSLNGNVIPEEMRTVNVSFFENNATLVVPTLSQTFTEALKDRVRSSTRLSIINNGEADGRMSGTITDYRIAPISIPATNQNVAPIAGASQLSITVRVKFVCDVCKDKKINFEDSFTKTANYSGDIASQETTLIQTITKQLIDDIFNRAFNNW
jgi:hypothetical protein